MTLASSPRSISCRCVGHGLREQKLSKLIGIIYDSAIDSSLWLIAIERSADFVGGAGAALFAKDIGADHASSAQHFKLRRRCRPISFSRPTISRERHFLGDLEEPIATTDLMPFRELAQTELFRQGRGRMVSSTS